MKTRRFLAVLLCAAMVLTSNAFNVNAFAETVDGQNSDQTVIVEMEEESIIEEENSVTDESGSELNDEASEDEASGESEEVISDDESGDEISDGESDEDISDEELSDEEGLEDETGLEEGELEGEELEEDLEEEDLEEENLEDEELKDIELEDDVEKLEDYADRYFTVSADGTLELKDEYKSIGLSAQMGKDRISSVIIPADAKKIPYDTKLFTNNTNITKVEFEDNSNLMTIEGGAFSGSHIESISLPSRIETIGDGAFQNCESLTSVYIGGTSLVSIPNGGFQGCSKLTSVTFSNSVKEIGSYAFKSCTSLNTINLRNVEEIGDSAFSGDSALAVITWSPTLERIGSNAFANNNAATKLFLDKCPLLEEVGSGAFSGWTKLTAISFPDSMKTISEKLFNGCSSLVTVTLGKSINRVEAEAFGECNKLTSVTFDNENTSDPDFYIDSTAFPSKVDNSFLKIVGYDGYVRNFANSKRYKYQSKNVFDITAITKKGVNIRIAPREIVEGEPGKARAGSIVKVTVTPNEGKTLVGNEGDYLNIEGKNGQPYNSEDVSLIGFTDKEIVFEFIMPKFDANVSVDVADISEVSKLTQTPIWMIIGDISGDGPSGGPCYVHSAGHKGTLLINGANREIPPWLLTFSSSNSKVATIDDFGIIRSTGKGSATITATVKSTGKKITLDVNVQNENVIEYFDISELINDTGIPCDDDIEDSENYTIMEFGKSDLLSGNQSVLAKLNVENKDGDTVFASSKWASNNTSIATVRYATTLDNENQITVKKGAEGEAIIKVTMSGNDGMEIARNILIRVVDNCPRLVDSKLSASIKNSNPKSKNLDDFSATSKSTLVPVYKYSIDKVYESLYDASENPQTWSTVVYDKDTNIVGININSNELNINEGASKTFKDSAKLYFKADISREDNNGRVHTYEVYIPITEFTVKNSQLAPSVSMSGKINLFFKGIAAGNVTLKQSLSNEIAYAYELVSTENYNLDAKGQERVYDVFANNFEIDDAGYITRTENELTKDSKGKDITSGYVYIYYKGYKDPVKKKITIPTQNTKPNYALNKSSASTSSYNVGQVYELQLLDKKTKQVVDLQDGCEAFFDDENTERGLWDSITVNQSNDTIVLQVKDRPKKGKAVFYVQQPDWSDGLKYTFSLNVTDKLPSAKASVTSVKLNSFDPEVTQDITFTSSNPDIPIAEVDDEVVFAGKDNQKPEADKIHFEANDNVLTISLDNPTDIAKGSYKFKVQTYVDFDMIGRRSLAQVSITVNVVSEQPTIKLKSSKFTTNVNYPGIESFETTYSFTNLPNTTFDFEVDSEKNIKCVNDDLASQLLKDYLHISFSEEGKMNLFVDSSIPINKKYSCKFDLEKLTIDGVEIKPIRIEVVGKDVAVSASAKATGTLNTLDDTSTINYKLSFKNISILDFSNVNVNFEEYDAKGIKLDDSNFEFANPIDSQGNVKIKVADGKRLDSKTKYKIWFVCDFGDPDDAMLVKNISITPKQVMPKIKTDVSKLTIYAGETNRSRDIEITKTSETGVNITGYEWAKGTADNVKKAFSISKNTSTDELIITLINPAQLTLNKAYKLSFNIICDGQLANTTGTAFNVEVMVKK